MSVREEKQVRLTLPDDEHEKLRHHAAAEGLPLSAVAREAVRRYIADKPVWRPVEDPGRKPRK
jgi:hypothetical protein